MGGAIGGGIFRIVEARRSSCDEGRIVLRSGELPPCGIVFNGARAGILEGLFGPPEAADTDMESGLRPMTL